MSLIFRATLERTGESPGGPCWCCGRVDIGLGALARQGQYAKTPDWDTNPQMIRPPSIVWTCARHLPLLRKVMTMTNEFGRIEQKAAQDAGGEAGAYLDVIGETDLAKLTDAQWREFCLIMIKSFGDAVERLVKDGEAPF